MLYIKNIFFLLYNIFLFKIYQLNLIIQMSNYSRYIFFEPNKELEKKYPGKSGFSNGTKKYHCDGTFILKNANKIKQKT